MTTSWGTLAYGLVAGFSVGISVLVLIIGMRSRRADPLMVSVGVFGLAAAIVGVLTLHLHASSTIEAYRDTFKLFGLANLVALVSIVILVAVWTGETKRWELTAFGVATVFVGVLQITLPFGLLADDLAGLRTVELLGEQFVVHTGATSPWRPALDVYLLASLTLIVVALVRSYRHGRRAAVSFMSFGLMMWVIVGAYDSLVDEGVADTPYLAPIGGMFILIPVAAYLADRVVRAERRLHDQTVGLEAVVVSRTAAVIDANDRLEQQLARQRRTAASLAALTHEFEASNAMVEPTRAEVNLVLERLLARLGSITAAYAVELGIHSAATDLDIPKTIGWQEAKRSDSDEPSTTIEPVSLGGRAIGDLIAHFDTPDQRSPEERRYFSLTAAHLAGLINRLELARRAADAAIENERQRIAMDLHDSVTQRLYSVSFLADAAVHMLDDDTEQLVETVKRLRQLVLSSIAEMRSLLFELRPVTLADVELTELLEQLADSMSSTSGVEVSVDLDPAPGVPADAKAGLYRIAQEAVSNACRHSGAHAVSVALRQEHGVTTLMVADEGVGFAPDDQVRGRGLTNIESRAAMLGAALELTSAPDTGTTVTVRWVQRDESLVASDRSGAV